MFITVCYFDDRWGKGPFPFVLSLCWIMKSLELRDVTVAWSGIGHKVNMISAFFERVSNRYVGIQIKNFRIHSSILDRVVQGQ